MSWEELKPAKATTKSYGIRQATPVMVSIGRLGRSQDYRLLIQVYPQKMGKEDSEKLFWWKEGQGVSVRKGEGEHKGQIQISNGGSFLLERLGSHPQCPVGVRLEVPEHLAKESRPRRGVGYEILEYQGIIVKLPLWVVESDRSQLTLFEEACETH